ncbi:MAG: type II toxin-antitoxin system HicB family antitoxin [Alphaproteobacteria bacterium]|nr:type II toxin-antitoxin system HicB family antitoxin [Alphaproteobacteria bacterium]
MRYTIVIEKAPANYAAFVPDLPGCVATAPTRQEAIAEIRQAIAFHIQSLREHGEAVPEPRCTATVVDIAAVA